MSSINDMLITSEEYKAMKEKYEKNYFKLFGDYCYYNGDNISIYSANKIAEKFKNKKVSITYNQQQISKGAIINNNKQVSKSFYQVWSEDPDMKEYDEVIFNCNTKKVKPNQFNLFDGFNHFNKLETDEIDLKPVFDHIKSLVNDDLEHYEYLISWLAHIVQLPHILPHTTLIFITKEGVGKGFFMDFLSEVFGQKYTGTVDKLDLVCGNFNSILGGKLLFCIDETDPIDSKNRIDNIKFLITAKKIVINGKYKDPVKSDNFCRFIFFTNRLFGFPIEEGNRRPVVFTASDRNLKKTIGDVAHTKYFKKILKMYGDKRYQNAFLNFLKKYDISKFSPIRFKKGELQNTLEENSINPLVGFLAIQVSENKTVSTLRVLTQDFLKMFSDYMRQRNYKFDYTQKKFNVELKSIFDIGTKKSNGYMVFELDIKHVKKILTEDYKYDFNNELDDNNDVLDCKTEENYKQMYIELLRENKKLNKRINELEDKINAIHGKKVEYTPKIIEEKEEPKDNDDLDELEKELLNL